MGGCDDWISSNCFSGTLRTILIINLIHSIFTFCITIVNLVTISSGRVPQCYSAVPAAVAYTAQIQRMPVSFSNPVIMTQQQL